MTAAAPTFAEVVVLLRDLGWSWTRVAAHYRVSEREVRRWLDEGAPDGLPAPPLAFHYSTALVVNDTQYPYHDAAVWEATCQVAADNEVELVVYNGDILDFPGLSSFKHDPYKVTTAAEDVKGFHRDLLDPLRSAVYTATGRVPEEWWLDGNHEDRYRAYMEHNASALGDCDPVRFMGLEGMAYLPYGQRLGHRLAPALLVTHGWSVARNACRNHVEQTGLSVIHGHTHRVSNYMVTVADSTLGGWECGHMSDPSRVPGFHKAGHPNWQQVIGTLVRRSRTGGSFHVEVGAVFGVNCERAILGGREYRLDRPRSARTDRPPSLGTEGTPTWAYVH